MLSDLESSLAVPSRLAVEVVEVAPGAGLGLMFSLGRGHLAEI